MNETQKYMFSYFVCGYICKFSICSFFFSLVLSELDLRQLFSLASTTTRPIYFASIHA